MSCLFFDGGIDIFSVETLHNGIERTVQAVILFFSPHREAAEPEYLLDDPEDGFDGLLALLVERLAFGRLEAVGHLFLHGRVGRRGKGDGVLFEVGHADVVPTFGHGTVDSWPALGLGFFDGLFAVVASVGQDVFWLGNLCGDAFEHGVELLFVVGFVGDQLPDDQQGVGIDGGVGSLPFGFLPLLRISSRFAVFSSYSACFCARSSS